MGRSALFRWLLVVLCCCASLLFLSDKKFDDNILDMLPDGSVRKELAQLQKMELVDRLFITLYAEESLTESAAREALQKGAAGLTEKMLASGLFSWVQAGVSASDMQQGYSLLMDHLPELLGDDERSQIAAMLTPDTLQGILRNDFLLLNSPAGLGIRNQIARDPLGLSRFIGDTLRHLQAEFTVTVKNGLFFSADGRSVLLMAKSARPTTDTKESERLQQGLAKMFAESLPPGVKAESVGAFRHTLANSRAVRYDLYLLLPAASLLLLLLLVCSLRNWRSLAVFAVPFLAAPVAVALTAAIFGSINLIAMGFGIVILGIAVDFAIHIYVELRQGGSLLLLRRPLFFAASTTLGVLAVLFFSAVPCQRQMAALAFFGVLLGILFALLLIPLLVDKAGCRSGQDVLLQQERIFTKKAGKRGLILWGLVVIFSFTLWPELHYNGDMQSLDAAASLDEERRFAQRWKSAAATGTEQFFVVAQGKEMDEALERSAHLLQLLTAQGVHSVQTISSILPGAKKQRIRQEKWRRLWQQHPDFKRDFLAAARENGFSSAAFSPFLASLTANTPLLQAADLLHSPFSSLVQNMVVDGAEGSFILTLGFASAQQLSQLAEYCSRDNGLTFFSNNSWKKKMEKALKADIFSLSLLAGGIVFALVLLQFRSLRRVVAVFAPVLSALAAIAIFCWLTGGALNMMHLIMAILVIGLSVDYGIFRVCMAGSKAVNTVTAFALSICAASSLIGFGTLAFASHPVLHSIGVTVLVGIGASWPAALWITPALLDLEEAC